MCDLIPVIEDSPGTASHAVREPGYHARRGWFVGVLEALDKPMPIGIASQVGQTEGGLAVWCLNVDGADVPGRWVIIDGRFVPVECAPA